MTLCRRRPVSVYPDGNITTCNLGSPSQRAEHLDVAHRVEPEAMLDRAAEGPHLPEAVVHGTAFEWRISPNFRRSLTHQNGRQASSLVY